MDVCHVSVRPLSSIAPAKMFQDAVESEADAKEGGMSDSFTLSEAYIAVTSSGYPYHYCDSVFNCDRLDDLPDAIDAEPAICMTSPGVNFDRHEVSLLRSELSSLERQGEEQEWYEAMHVAAQYRDNSTFLGLAADKLATRLEQIKNRDSTKERGRNSDALYHIACSQLRHGSGNLEDTNNRQCAASSSDLCVPAHCHQYCSLSCSSRDTNCADRGSSTICSSLSSMQKRSEPSSVSQGKQKRSLSIASSLQSLSSQATVVSTGTFNHILSRDCEMSRYMIEYSAKAGYEPKHASCKSRSMSAHRESILIGKSDTTSAHSSGSAQNVYKDVHLGSPFSSVLATLRNHDSNALLDYQSIAMNVGSTRSTGWFASISKQSKTLFKRRRAPRLLMNESPFEKSSKIWTRQTKGSWMSSLSRSQKFKRQAAQVLETISTEQHPDICKDESYNRRWFDRHQTMQTIMQM